MPRILACIILFISLTAVGNAQTTYNWIGGAVGDYQDPTNWSPLRTIPAANDILDFNVASDIAVVNVPNQTIGAISIVAGTATVSFATNIVTNVLSVSSATPLNFVTGGSILAGTYLTIALTNSGSFTISQGTFGIAPSTGGKISIGANVVLAGGTLDFDVAGSGGASVASGGSITYTSGTFNCATATVLTWLPGSNYYHNLSGSAPSSIPTATWNTGSTCNITGMNAGTNAPTGLTGITFSSITWNCPSQNGDVDLNLGGQTVNLLGTFSIGSTGANRLILADAGAAHFNASAYNQTGGTLVLQNATGNTSLVFAGSFAQNGGTIDFVSGSGAGTSLLSVGGDLIRGAGSTWTSSGTSTMAQMNLQFAGGITQSVTANGAWSITAGCFNIINSNSDPVGVIVTGTLQVINANSAAAATCTTSGLFKGTGAINYSGSGIGANNYSLVYNGTNPQTVSAIEFPLLNGPVNLNVVNLAGISFPASFSRTLAGTLTMVMGNMNLGAGNTLTLSNPNIDLQLSYTAGYITGGALQRYFPATGLPVSATSSSRFPLGSGNNDRSIYLYFSSASPGATAGYISISHNAIANASALATPFIDNGSNLDKITNSNWVVNSSTFNTSSGAITMLAQANNIGTVIDSSTLRITDGLVAFGTLIPVTGSNQAPLLGKTALSITDINKTLYVGSDLVNPLQIVTYNWTGAVNTDWATAGNWTSTGSAYPSAPTEIALINAGPTNMPTIGSGESINIFQLVVGTGASLTMTGSGSLSVYDSISFTGTANFSGTSTFTYASSNNSQNILNLPYVNLSTSGTAAKILPPVTTITGNYAISGTTPTIGTGNFVYAAGTAASQTITATNYYILTITGNRALKTIWLGNAVNFNTIDVADSFSMTATNYVAKDGGYNTMNFSNSGSTTIPGFVYGNIKNAATGTTRIYDPLGSSDPTHAVNCRSLGASAISVTTGSKIIFTRAPSAGNFSLYGFNYNDLEIAGDYGGNTFSILPGATIGIAGIFTISAVNCNVNLVGSRFFYNGTGNQTVTALNYDNVWISGTAGASGTRTVTLPSAGTVGIRGQLAVTSPSTFTTGNGFVVTGSTVNFYTGSNTIPSLTPLVAGSPNYNNVTVTGGTRTLEANLTIGGNLSVIGTDSNLAQLNIGNNTSNRILTILGNISVTGTSASSAITSLIDLNSVNRLVQVKLAGNLSVSGTSQLRTGNDPNFKGTILFNGSNQQYSNTSSFRNKYINYIVGDGINPTSLTLNNSLYLTHSGVLPFSDTLTVANHATLNTGTQNITIGIDTATGTNNAAFNLNGGATLVTSNTGAGDLSQFALEGNAVDGTTGVILSSTNIAKNYNAAANYVLNGATINPFPGGITIMNNLTIGAPVSLNRAIVVSDSLDLSAYVLTQANNNLQFSALTSTTGSIYADLHSTLTIMGTLGNVGTLRFAAPGGNITGQLDIDRPVTIPLTTDLTIDNSALSGNFISGTASSILDINGHTLTMNGAFSGPGFFAGSATSNLTLGGGGNAGVINFLTGKQLLKNLTLQSNSTTATLGTALDITGGTGPGTEGTVSVTGAGAVLFTGGNLSLKSSASGTARVAAGSTAGGYINGAVTVERYLPSIRSWRLLSTPSIGQSIHQSWQENQPAGVNGIPGFGTNITGSAAVWGGGANGFDFQTPSSSLCSFNSVNDSWVSVPNTNLELTYLDSNKAYLLFLRGDRSVTPGVGNASTSAVLRSKGTLFQGDLPAVTVNAGHFLPISNNFASAVDYSVISTSNVNIDQSFSVWDPYVSGTNNLGGWVTFSQATGWLPSNTSGHYTGASNQRIESGQAFMVHNGSGSIGTLQIRENSKLSGSNLVSRPVVAKTMLQTNFYKTANGVISGMDGNTVVFAPEYSNAVDQFDAYKINNFSENFGLKREGKNLAVEARQPVNTDDTVFFNMYSLKQTDYRIEIIGSNFAGGITGYLEDKFLHTATPLNLNGTTTADFTVTADTGSYAANRFTVVFKVPPITFSNLTAVSKPEGIEVDWTVDNEINTISYDVEKSVDGRSFTKLLNKLASGNNSGGTVNYHCLDVKPVVGDNFYRIRRYDNVGGSAYSNIVKVNIASQQNGFTVYPNPVINNQIGLQLNNIPAGSYTVRLANNNGQVLLSEKIIHPGGTATRNISPSQALVSGTYQLEIIDAGNKIAVIRLLVL